MLHSYSGTTISIQGTEISIVEESSGQICIVLESTADGLERNISVTLATIAGTASNHTLRTVKMHYQLPVKYEKRNFSLVTVKKYMLFLIILFLSGGSFNCFFRFQVQVILVLLQMKC